MVMLKLPKENPYVIIRIVIDVIKMFFFDFGKNKS